MVEEATVKTPPPTQHISFDDEEAKIATEIPKLTGLTHPDLSGEEIQEFVQKYNIEIAYSPEDNFRQMSHLTLGIGFVMVFIIWIINIGTPGYGSNMACCSIMLIAVGIAPLFDAGHYTKKKQWQQKHAMNHSSSDFSIAFNVILGMLFLFIGIVLFLLYIIQL